MIGQMKHILAAEQKKTDFKPEDENNVLIQYTNVSKLKSKLISIASNAHECYWVRDVSYQTHINLAVLFCTNRQNSVLDYFLNLKSTLVILFLMSDTVTFFHLTRAQI